MRYLGNFCQITVVMRLIWISKLSVFFYLPCIPILSSLPNLLIASNEQMFPFRYLLPRTSFDIYYIYNYLMCHVCFYKIVEGYGQTECTAAATMTYKADFTSGNFQFSSGSTDKFADHFSLLPESLTPNQ